MHIRTSRVLKSILVCNIRFPVLSVSMSSRSERLVAGQGSSRAPDDSVSRRHHLRHLLGSQPDHVLLFPDDGAGGFHPGLLSLRRHPWRVQLLCQISVKVSRHWC